MKFSLQSLLWLTTLIAVLLGSWMWIRRERVLNQRQIDMTLDQAKEIREFGIMEMARADLYRRNLGHFNSNEKQQPFIRFVALPRELGGRQLHGLPFTWRWRLFLPSAEELKKLVVCCAVEEIPRKGFELPSKKIFRSAMDGRDCEHVAGILGMSFGDESIDYAKPAEVLLIIRLEYDDGSARLFVNFEIEQSGTFFRGKSFDIESDNKQDWLRDTGLSAYLYEVSGFGIENNYELPRLDETLGLDGPALLMRLRGKRHIKDFKYEEFDGTADGLMIWLDTQPSN